MDPGIDLFTKEPELRLDLRPVDWSSIASFWHGTCPAGWSHGIKVMRTWRIRNITHVNQNEITVHLLPVACHQSGLESLVQGCHQS